MSNLERNSIFCMIVASIGLWTMIGFGIALIATVDPWHLWGMLAGFCLFMLAGIVMLWRDWD